MGIVRQNPLAVCDWTGRTVPCSCSHLPSGRPALVLRLLGELTDPPILLPIQLAVLDEQVEALRDLGSLQATPQDDAPAEFPRNLPSPSLPNLDPNPDGIACGKSLG